MYYFGSGPASLPEEVLEAVARKVVRHQGKDLSVLELPHRGSVFQEMVQESESLVRDLLGLDDTYAVCWMHGGGRTQFGLIPMNFLNKEATAGFIESGYWAHVAQTYADFYGRTVTLASSKAENYTFIPSWGDIPEDLAYLHLTTNNTLYGTQYFQFPRTKAPLVADMTSELFSRKLDYQQFALIYAAAQKNIGPAGVTLVVVRKDFLEKQKDFLPGIFSYKELTAAHSVYNTPPVFAIYCSLLYLRWTARMGMDMIVERNETKSRLLYEAVDESNLFNCPVKTGHRSQMNVCFRTQNPEQEEAFINFAKRFGISGIGGHRKVGGIRVGLYNAISVADVSHLIEVMHRFEASFK